MLFYKDHGAYFLCPMAMYLVTVLCSPLYTRMPDLLVSTEMVGSFLCIKIIKQPSILVAMRPTIGFEHNPAINLAIPRVEMAGRMLSYKNSDSPIPCCQKSIFLHHCITEP